MSRDNKQPYVRFFSSDWLAGTRGMTAAEVGIYITLVAMMYERCEPVPEEPRRIARQCGCSLQVFKKTLNMLVQDRKVLRVDGGLWNKRVDEEFAFRAQKTEHAKKAGHESARKKANKNKDREQRMLNVGSTDGQPYQNPESRSHISSDRSVEVDRSVGTHKPKRGLRLPDDWEPTQANIDYARGEGFALEAIERIADQFRDHWLAKAGKDATKRDWSAAWRTWVRNQKDWRGTGRDNSKPNGRGASQHESYTEIAARVAARRDAKSQAEQDAQHAVATDGPPHEPDDGL